MYKIKQVLEDFVVEEIPVVKTKESGRHILFLLEKRNISTPATISIIKKRFNLRPSEIGYSGLKDKFALTKQFITIKNRSFLTKDFDFKNFSLKFIGFSEERLLLGNLFGNKFKIVVRNLNTEEIKRLQTFRDDSVLFPNYFGEQRFSKKNYLVGIEILHQNFDQALNLILSSNKNKFLNRELTEHIKKYRNDFLGSLRILPREILLLYIHSFQSLVFDEVLSSLISELCPEKFDVKINDFHLYFSEMTCLKEFYKKEVPIVGFGSESNKNKFWDKALNESVKIRDSFNVKKQNFIIRKVPDLSLEGSSRKAVVRAENFKFTLDKDDLNNGMKKATLCFELSKGSYATVLVRELFGA